MNTVYRNLIIARIQAAVEAARAVTNMTHKGLKGQLREILIRDLFRPLLPADVGVASGQIISSDDRQSREQDVVIFDKRILPPILLEQARGIFPIESVLYAIEVKSRMTANEMKKSHRSATEVMQFRYQSGDYDDFDRPTDHIVEKVISCVFAFDTDLISEGKNETHRYDEIRGSDDPAIKAICVVGRGYWYWYNGRWKTWKRKPGFEEVVGFIAGVMNTYRRVAATRGEPRLGRYLIDD